MVALPARPPVRPEHALAEVAYVANAAAIAQAIHDLIAAARSSIVLQMYMFAGNGETEALRRLDGAFPYAHTVAGWLVAKKRRDPGVDIVVVLDTQTIDQPRLTRNRRGPLARDVMAAAGITVLHANLFGTTFDPRRRFPASARLHDGRHTAVSPEAYGRAQQRWQTWHNVEDHRKNLVIDEGAWAAVTSHNFLDIASAWHENLFLVGAPAAGGVWDQARASIAAALELPQRIPDAERARLAALAARPATSTRAAPPGGAPVPALAALGDAAAIPAPHAAAIEVLATTEIRPRLVAALDDCGAGDRVRAASTWFSDVALLDRFVAAAERGADVQLLVDDLAALPLGRIPSWFVRALANLRVIERAAARARPGFALRVHPSANRRMMHLKTCAFDGPRRAPFLIGGQANYTPNSFNGAWHETDVVVHGAGAVRAFEAQYGPLWDASAPPRLGWLPGRLARRALLWLVEHTVFTF
jgi:phosphatidylserine/phosphatidylglycerophosphate/cardiolipin synthase-like enzyme